MKWLLKFFLVKLKIRYWGVGFELKLPPEFIITEHGQSRMERRIEGLDKNWPQWVIKAWYEGTIPPFGDYREKYKKRAKEAHFGKVAYRFYGGYVFVFGCNWNPAIAALQKHLITVFRWIDNLEK